MLCVFDINRIFKHCSVNGKLVDFTLIFIVMKRFWGIIGLFLYSVFTFAQTRVVYGELTMFNHFPAKNVVVQALKAKTSVTTDSLGRFGIVCNTKDVLKIDSKVFQKVTIRINQKTDSVKENLLFVETPENQELAIGYGYISSRDLTFALSNLSSENSDFCKYSDIYELIRGKCAGVRIVSGDNMTGGDKCIQIRGVNSFVLNTCALVVVDGVPMQSVSGITPCLVKSVTILKDGAAAIYGARGANGVVFIEMKK